MRIPHGNTARSRHKDSRLKLAADSLHKESLPKQATAPERPMPLLRTLRKEDRTGKACLGKRGCRRLITTKSPKTTEKTKPRGGPKPLGLRGSRVSFRQVTAPERPMQLLRTPPKDPPQQVSGLRPQIKERGVRPRQGRAREGRRERWKRKHQTPGAPNHPSKCRPDKTWPPQTQW